MRAAANMQVDTEGVNAGWQECKQPQMASPIHFSP